LYVGHGLVFVQCQVHAPLGSCFLCELGVAGGANVSVGESCVCARACASICSCVCVLVLGAVLGVVCRAVICCDVMCCGVLRCAVPSFCFLAPR
jgi:hypothetical protein